MTHHLHYVPNTHDASYGDIDSYGTVPGLNSIIAASVVAELSMTDSADRTYTSPETVKHAIRAAVQRIFRTFRDGFGTECDFEPGAIVDTWQPRNLFRELTVEGICKQAAHNSPAVGFAAVPKSHSNSWSILNEESQYATVNVARSIVLNGPKEAINQPIVRLDARFLFKFSLVHYEQQAELRRGATPDLAEEWYDIAANAAIRDLPTPIQDDKTVGSNAILTRIVRSVKDVLMREGSFAKSGSGDRAVNLLAHCLWGFQAANAALIDYSESASAVHVPTETIGVMTLIERQDIENFRNIYNLAYQHLRAINSGRLRRPLSIAVFGPPGSGKSFGIKQVIRSLVSPNRSIKELEYNVSQFTSVSDIQDALRTVAHYSKKFLPVVFFDEFDSSHGSTELGWLKMFLGPMEDGAWGTGTNKEEFAEAIFVFAGGTSSTYLDFSRDDPSITDSQRAQFSEAKGPDFVSRLKAHIDTLGINPSEIANGGYILRRAIQIRTELSDLGLISAAGKVEMDTDMLTALLLVPYYKHGGRSLRSIIEMSFSPDRGVTKAAIPTLRQLNMHVDGKRFMDIINGKH